MESTQTNSLKSAFSAERRSLAVAAVMAAAIVVLPILMSQTTSVSPAPSSQKMTAESTTAQRKAQRRSRTARHLPAAAAPAVLRHAGDIRLVAAQQIQGIDSPDVSTTPEIDTLSTGKSRWSLSNLPEFDESETWAPADLNARSHRTQSETPDPYGETSTPSRSEATMILPGPSERFSPPHASGGLSGVDLQAQPIPPSDSARGGRGRPGRSGVLAGAPQDSPLWWEQQLSGSILPGRQSMPLTLHRALGLALTEAPELQVLHADWYIQQTEQERLAAAFDWTTFVDAIWNRDSTPVGSDLDGAARRLRQRGLTSSSGLRRLTRDGSELEVSQSFGTLNSNSRFINPNNQATSRLALEYERPLLRGAGEDIATGQVRLAGISTASAFDQFQIGVQDHLLQVASAYWTLTLQRGRFLQAVRSWNRAGTIAAEMEKRINVDVTPGMLNRARSEVATRLSDSIEAEHDVIRSQDALLRLIYGARFTDFVDSEVITSSLPMRKSAAVELQPQIERAVRDRSEIHLAIREVKAASVRYNLADNQVLPMLNMIMTGYVAGLRGNNDVGGSFLNQFTEGEPGAGIGFNFEIPYRNRAARAAREQAQIAIRRMQAQFHAAIGRVSEDVRNQLIQRNKFGELLTQQHEVLERAVQILVYTQKRRELLVDGNNVADLYLENLLQMQRRLADAEYGYLRSQVRYTLADNALLRAISALDSIAERTGAVPAIDCAPCRAGHAGSAR